VCVCVCVCVCAEHRTFSTLKLIDRHPLMAAFPQQPGQAGTRKVKPNWIFMKQGTTRGSDKSLAPRFT